MTKTKKKMEGLAYLFREIKAKTDYAETYHFV